MKIGLLVAAALLVAIALVHSVLGERYILRRLFRRENLPRLFGSDWFTKQTLRFAWHITSIAWLGFAVILALNAAPAAPSPELVVEVIAATFLITGVIAALASRGRHLSWVVFLSVAALALLAF